MDIVSSLPTLFDDWQWRRERLIRGPHNAARFADEQIKLLDYLIHRYRDLPEAQRPARVAPRAELYLDERAIVVHHHLWEGKVGGVSNASEARTRVAHIVQRLAVHSSLDASDRDDPASQAPFDPDDDDAVDPLVWSGVCARIRRNGSVSDLAIARAMGKNPFPPKSVAEFLYRRIISSQPGDVEAAFFLVQGQNCVAARYVVFAWQELVVNDRTSDALELPIDFLTRHDSTGTALQEVRRSLAHSNYRVRLAALDILAQVGTLEDVGLLSDLLALPTAADEHRDERAEMLRALRSIAEAAR